MTIKCQKCDIADMIQVDGMLECPICGFTTNPNIIEEQPTCAGCGEQIKGNICKDLHTKEVLCYPCFVGRYD